MKKIIFTPLLLLASFLSHAELLEVVPDSYVFDMPTDDGAADYADQTGEQLIDGRIHNDDEWLSDLGDGYSYDIVGWGEWDKGENITFVNIDFSFEESTYLSSLTYGAFTDLGPAIYSPNVNIYAFENGGWELKTSLEVTHPYRDESISTRDEYTIDLGFTTDLLRFEAYRVSDAPYRDHYWTFIDEVDFYTLDGGSANIANVSFYSAFGGLFLMGMLMKQNRSRRRNGKRLINAL